MNRRLIALLGITSIFVITGCDIFGSDNTEKFQGVEVEQEVEMGEPVQGALEDSDSQLKELRQMYSDFLASKESYVDVYKFSPEGKSDTRIELRSNDLDTFLFLVDEKGNVVGLNDDDHQSTLDATIEKFNLSSGKYFILATSRVNDTGDYELDIDDF